MTSSSPRSGYTLPVFACAAAVAALYCLRHSAETGNVTSIQAVSVDLIEPAETAEISIEQVARLRPGMVLAITKSDPGDNLDLTRHTPVWALVEWGLPEQIEPILVVGGEGIGRQLNAGNKAAIYAYATQLLQENLKRQLKEGEKIQVTIILPEGRALGLRTSNAAFGVVEGLSLLGTSGISQPLSSPAQLEVSLEELRQQVRGKEMKQPSTPNLQPPLVLCVGENGLDLAQQLGISSAKLVKAANWLGPLLVEAGVQQLKSILLFGYHGKLLKLAGGIFHTHHHLADGRLEILTAHCAQLGLSTPDLHAIFSSATAEDALKYLRNLDSTMGSNWVNQVYGAIAETIDQRSQSYIYNHSERQVQVGSVLFDRQRQIIVKSQMGSAFLSQLC